MEIHSLLRHLTVMRTIGRLRGRAIRRDWRYQRSNQNLYIEEEQTTQ